MTMLIGEPLSALEQTVEAFKKSFRIERDAEPPGGEDTWERRIRGILAARGTEIGLALRERLFKTPAGLTAEGYAREIFVRCYILRTVAPALTAEEKSKMKFQLKRILTGMGDENFPGVPQCLKSLIGAL
jgi:hypothetical protein